MSNPLYYPPCRSLSDLGCPVSMSFVVTNVVESICEPDRHMVFSPNYRGELFFYNNPCDHWLARMYCCPLAEEVTYGKGGPFIDPGDPYLVWNYNHMVEGTSWRDDLHRMTDILYFWITWGLIPLVMNLVSLFSSI